MLDGLKMAHPNYGWNIPHGWKRLKMLKNKKQIFGRFGLVPNLATPKP